MVWRGREDHDHCINYPFYQYNLCTHSFRSKDQHEDVEGDGDHAHLCHLRRQTHHSFSPLRLVFLGSGEQLVPAPQVSDEKEDEGEDKGD